MWQRLGCPRFEGADGGWDRPLGPEGEQADGEQAEVFMFRLQVVHRRRAAGQVRVLAQEESSRSHSGPGST